MLRPESRIRKASVLPGALLLGVFICWSAGFVCAGSASGASEKPNGRSVMVTTTDGLRLHALYWEGKPDGMGVVLVHAAGRSSEDWRRFGERLARNGVHAIAVDLRGHGRNTTGKDGEPMDPGALRPEDYLSMTKDVGAAVQYLREKTAADPNHIVLMGASLGANLAIRYAAEDSKISNVILLSPGIEYQGVTAESAVQRYGARPLFIAVSREDRFAAKSALVLDAIAKGKKTLKICSGAGHGTGMLRRDPSLEPEVYKWLYGALPDEPQ